MRHSTHMSIHSNESHNTWIKLLLLHKSRHIKLSHATHSKSSAPYRPVSPSPPECVIPHTGAHNRMTHITGASSWCVLYSRVTYRNKVMSQMWIGHFTHVNESRCTHLDEWLVSQVHQVVLFARPAPSLSRSFPPSPSSPQLHLWTPEFHSLHAHTHTSTHMHNTSTHAHTHTRTHTHI